MLSRRENILCTLTRREYNSKSYLRTNLNILRQLILQKDGKYQQIWKKHSNSPIYYEGYGQTNSPCTIYELPSLVKNHKVEDALAAQYPLEAIPHDARGWRGSLFVVTKDSWLIRYDMHTGQKLQSLYLSNKHAFKLISWDVEGYTFSIKSTHTKAPANVFGHNVVDASVTLGTMAVLHNNESVHIYSWQHIVEQGRQFDIRFGDLHEGQIVGNFPSGLPVNIQLTERPPVLFSVRCGGHALIIGGNPFHYIISPPRPRRESHFSVYSLESSKLAENGCLETEEMSMERDKCFFHADDSGRIVLYGPDEIRILRIKETGMKMFRIDREFVITSSDLKKCVPRKNKIAGETVTMSGRVVKRINIVEDSFNYDYDCIQCVDYENELDLLTVCAAHETEEGYMGCVYFIDNYTGEILKEIQLEEPWREFHDHTVIVDLDTIIHIVKAPMRRWSCYIHKLDRSLDEPGHVTQHKPDHVTNHKSNDIAPVNFSRYAIRRRRQHNAMSDLM